MRSEDVVVIGAGVGGLVSAIELARAGLGVTVVERAARAGGKMREVEVGGARFDAGPTVLTMRWVFDEIFAAAGSSLEAHVTLKLAEILARHAWSADERLDLFADMDRSADAIGDFAGAREAAGYRAFCAEARRIHDTLKNSFLTAQKAGPIGLTRSIFAEGGNVLAIRPYETMWRALGGHFADPRLKQLFGRYATYCGSSPFAAPATLMLVAHVEQSGVWLVDGGMQRLAEALERLAVSLGVRFRYRAHVEAIGVGRRGAESVTLAGGERLSADRVVVNADAGALGVGLFGPDAARAVPATPARARSLSAVTWAMEARVHGFPLVRHNVFFSDGYAAEFQDIFRRGRLPSAPTIYLCAQDRADAAAEPAGPERLFLLVNAPANGDRGGLDGGEVATCMTRVLDHLRVCGLEVSPRSTPLTTTPADFNALFPATGGALYGRATHGWAAAFERSGAATRIPRLYLAGGGAHPGAGAPMAALSGRLAAQRVIRDRASTRLFHRVAMPGGMLTPSATTAGMA